MSLLLLAALVAADPNPPVATRLGNDVIASPDGKSAFVRNKDGGIAALDLATGKTRWVSKDASELAGASDKLVFAWASVEKKPNAFRIVGIDATTGKAAFTSEPITMPDWAAPGNGGGRSFRTSAYADGEKIVALWQANTFYFGGARPTPEIEAAARREAVGVVAINPTTGKLTTDARKPKAEEFGKFDTKLGGVEFGVEEQLPGFGKGGAMMTKVTLTARKDGKELWKTELAGRPWSPPPP